MGISSWGLKHVAGRVAVALCACAAVPAFSASAAMAAGPTGGVARLGFAPADKTVELALPLQADEAGLQRFATAVSTPGSQQYGQYESIPSLARRFGASPAARSRVVGFLRRSGATGVKIDVTGLFADATMSVSTAQSLFGSSLGNFRTAAHTRFMAPDSTVQIPAALRSAVTGVVGLDTRPVFGSSQAEISKTAAWPHKSAVAAPGQVSSYDESGYLQRTGTAGGCPAATSQTGFTPNQYLTAYNYTPLQSAGILGQGERVALIEIDGFKYSDLRSFSKCFGLATPAINGYGVGLRHPLAPGGESTLDLEVLDAAAPQAQGRRRVRVAAERGRRAALADGSA